MRALLIGALALTLAGCSRQPPPQMTDASCVSPNPFACFMAVGLPMPVEISFRGNSAQPAPVHDKAAAHAEIARRPRHPAGASNHSRYAEIEPRPVRTRGTHARHLTCRAVSETPCTLHIPVCPAATDQRRSCAPATPVFVRKPRPLPV